MATAIMRYGFIVALPGEARAAAGGRWQWQDGWPVKRLRSAAGEEQIWVRCGIGPQRAAAAARWLVTQQVHGLALFGVSGGLGPDLVPGDLVLAAAVLDCCETEQPIRLDLVDEGCELALLIAGIRVQHGPVLTVTSPIRQPEHKAMLFQRHGALAVDMESAAVARVAAEEAIPCTVLRSICDPAQRSVAEEAFGIVDGEGRLRIKTLLVSVINRLGLVTDLLRMQRDFGPALRSLKQAAPVVIRQVMGGKIENMG